MIRFQMPKLRIYQQILICFGVVVVVPLLGVSFIIHSINQYALKKELARFAEHTAEAMYKDFGTEMSWQKQQSQLMARLLTDDMRDGRSFEAGSRRILDLDGQLDAVGLYDDQGRQIRTSYRDFGSLSPELRLPDEMPVAGNGRPHTQPFEVIYFNTGNPQESPYYLRATLPLSSGPALIPSDVKHMSSAPARAAYYVHQKNFGYLQNLVRSHSSLYAAFYIIDSQGTIIAGPSGADRQTRISKEDYAHFVKTPAGVTHEYSSPSQTAQEQTNAEGEEDRPLKKVIVKMPDINWGIIIESPYHVKQKYIQRAGTQTLFLIAGTLVVILLLVLPYILGISRNFRQLIKGVKAMGEGNYYRRIRLISNFFTPYEIVYLTLEFNRMARKVADSWQTIQDANRKLAQMDEFKSNLIDTVSHELRTPLTSIKGYTSRLLRYDGTLDSETRIKSLKVVKQQADRLSRLVEDLLVIPDLEKASLRVYPDQVQLAPLLDNVIEFVQMRQGHEHDIRLSVEHGLGGNVSVLADPDRLEQILLNLLDNAVKYSLPDTAIEVRVEREERENAQIAISVINRCEPFPMEQLEELDSLFDKFKRLDDSLVRTTRGSGLGLFITRGLVEAMGGEISLSYEEGSFQVRFTVPLFAMEPQMDVIGH